MAKSLRASRIKTNKSHLRAKVHQPIEDARIERLSAKLLDLASKPKEETKRPDTDMVVDDEALDEPNATGSPAVEKMDLDGKSTKLTRSKPKPGRAKVLKKRKAKVVFAVGKQHGKRRSTTKGYQGPGVR